MAGGGFHVHGECGDRAAEAGGADAEGVDAAQEFGFQFGVRGVGVRLAEGAQQRVFREQRTAFEVAADAHADDERRAGVDTLGGNALGDELSTPSRPSAGLSICSALAFSLPPPFGSSVRRSGRRGPVQVDDRRSVIAGIHTAQGVRDH